MIPGSIKWRLQIWYGLILVAVLAGFGVSAYQLERNRVFRRVDGEIHRRTGALAELLHNPHRNGQPPHGRDGQPPPPEFADDRPPPEPDEPPHFDLPPRVAALFGTNDPANFYYRISFVAERGGREIARSDNYRKPPVELASFRSTLISENRIEDGPARPAERPPALNVGEDRIAMESLPSGELLEVGCSIAPELRELQRTALSFWGVGAMVLLVGMAGGWWFVGRALRPIADISATAAKISSGDLSQRINNTEAGSELGQLAAVLNSTFARLETAFAQQKQFASDAAHELRTPVTVILTQTQLALGRERDAAGYKQTVETCQRAAQRMRKLIETLLELARFDAGQEMLKRMKFNLADTVGDGVEMIQPLAAERRIKIVSRLDPVALTGDSERLTQVVTNLLTNAVQYNRMDGEIRITLSEQAGLAVLEIADTGAGIAPEDQPRVFERFFRSDPSRTGGGNTGLGLSICKAIVEAHGGTIEFSSRQNVGTTFVVRLPNGS